MPLRRVEHPGSGLAWYAFDCPGLRHGMVTRLGGVSRGSLASLNLGSTVGDTPEAVTENHARLFAAFGIERDDVVSPHQVHGQQVAVVDRSHGGTVIPSTDALITAQPGLVLLLRFADCTPVLFYDPVHHVAALAHAGWRGVAAGVVGETVRVLADRFGTMPAALWAGIGPAIGPDHYIVGAEVVEAIQATLPAEEPIAWLADGQWHLDLPGAVGAQLRMAGVGTIEQSGLCTASRTDEWYSHRAEKGHTGRFGVLALLA